MALHCLMLRNHFVGFFVLLVLHSCGQSQSPTLETPTAPPSVDVKLKSPDSINAELNWSVDELTGRFDPSKHQDFVRIQSAHTSKENIYLRKESYEAFVKMYDAAKKEGIRLTIISATRNFDYQKGIWEKKWLREKYKGWSDFDKVKDILSYSSMPGTSRHHWGTDVDFNSVDPKFFASGEGKKLYDWLLIHASEYGFAQTYTHKKSGRTGYEEEKWHWSYMPLASEMLKDYNTRVKYEDLHGFHGAEQADDLKVFETFVNGIDASLK